MAKIVTWCDEITIHPTGMWHHSQHKLYRNHRNPLTVPSTVWLNHSIEHSLKVGYDNEDVTP